MVVSGTPVRSVDLLSTLPAAAAGVGSKDKAKMAAYTFDCCYTGVMLFFAASSTFTQKCQEGKINAKKKNGNDLEGFSVVSAKISARDTYTPG